MCRKTLLRYCSSEISGLVAQIWNKQMNRWNIVAQQLLSYIPLDTYCQVYNCINLTLKQYGTGEKNVFMSLSIYFKLNFIMKNESKHVR